MSHRWLTASGSMFPDPDTSHDWLGRELSRPEYQESLLERFSNWFGNLFDAASEAAGKDGLSPLFALVLLVVLVAVVAVALSRLRANPGPVTRDAEVYSETRLTADEHRGRAGAALEQERWGVAVVESVRALAAGLVERGLMPEQPGVTVREISERAARLFPAHLRRLEVVSRLFDETRYGDRPADEQQARDVVELEHELGTLRPTDTGARGPRSAVPR